MSQLRSALLRLFGGLAILALAVLCLNALWLSQRHWAEAAAARAAPEPPVMALGSVADLARQHELRLAVRIDAVLDVAVAGGLAQLYLLADPSDAADSPPRAAVLVSPAQLPAFRAMLAERVQAMAGDAPLLVLSAKPALPYWIDRAEAAAAEAGHPLPPQTVFLHPFLHGRAQGLAPPLLSYLVPAALILLLAAILLGGVARTLRRRRAFRALEGLATLDRAAEALAAEALHLPPGDPRWLDLTSRRQHLRLQRQHLDARLARGLSQPAARWPWLALVAVAGFASLLPRRVLVDALSVHVIGADLAALLASPPLAAPVAAAEWLFGLPARGAELAAPWLSGPLGAWLANLSGLSALVWTGLAGSIFLMAMWRLAQRRGRGD